MAWGLATATTRARRSGETRKRKTARMLVTILDDMATNRSTFSKLAASIANDVTVSTFADPEIALRWLETNGSDLIITDYSMLHMDGSEFISRVRELKGSAELTIIVITVY